LGGLCGAGEDPQEYEKLLNDFWDQYQPIGRAEELEVERIVLCWWRLKRAWRYENAVIHIGVRDFARQEIAYQEEYLQQLEREGAAILLELRNAKNTIELTGGRCRRISNQEYSRSIRSLNPFGRDSSEMSMKI
jgi:hypothetical protein